MAFCPVCGDDAVDVFCESCLREREPLIKEIKPFTLTVCPSTDEIEIRGDWFPLKKFSRLVEKVITYNSRAQILEVDFPLPVFEEKPRDFTLPILVTGTVSKFLEPYEEEYEIEIPVEIRESPKASLSKSGYFEGTLQLRNPRDDVVKAIEELVSSADNAHIARVKDVRGGIDFEFTNQEYMVSLVYELRKRFGGLVQKNAKLHTYDHQTSKKVYRLTCLLRLPKFWVGDVIQTRKRLMKVTSMGSSVHGWDLERRKYTSFPCPSDKEFVVYEQEQVVLSSTRPHAMILDPDTFQEVPLAHSVDEPAGSELSVVFVDGKYFVADMLPSEHQRLKERRAAKKQ